MTCRSYVSYRVFSNKSEQLFCHAFPCGLYFSPRQVLLFISHVIQTFILIILKVRRNWDSDKYHLSRVSHGPSTGIGFISSLYYLTHFQRCNLFSVFFPLIQCILSVAWCVNLKYGFHGVWQECRS